MKQKKPSKYLGFNEIKKAAYGRFFIGFFIGLLQGG
jgi:hypothetical protein